MSMFCVWYHIFSMADRSISARVVYLLLSTQVFCPQIINTYSSKRIWYISLKTNKSHPILPQLCTQASTFRTDRRVRTWSPATLTWTPLSAMTYLEWRQLATALKCTPLQLPHCTAPQSVHCTDLKPLHTARWRHPVLRQWCSLDTLTTWWWDTEIQAAIRRHELNAFL